MKVLHRLYFHWLSSFLNEIENVLLITHSDLELLEWTQTYQQPSARSKVQRQPHSLSKINHFLLPVRRVAVTGDETLGSASPFRWNRRARRGGRRSGGRDPLKFLPSPALNSELLFNYKTECQDVINRTEKGKRKHALFFPYKWGSELLPIKVNQICFSQKFQPKGRMPETLNR